MARFQRLDQGCGINEGATADVYQDRAGPHLFQGLLADDVAGFGRQGNVERHDLALSGQGEGSGIFDAELGRPFMIGEWIVSEHFHSEATKNLGDDASNFPGSDNTSRFAMQIESDKSAQREI